MMKICEFITFLSQEDIAFKQKQREEAKKLKEMQAKASQKGPMGMYLSVLKLELSVTKCRPPPMI